ncbi:MAG: hypothetical protein WDM79_04280 [Terricaulis sp.]
MGFELIKIGGAPTARKVLSAIDNLGARGAQGFVICTPDTRLGAAIQQRATANDLKVMSVDDRLVGADGAPIEAIPHVGISATQIGRQVGEAVAAEATRRVGRWAISGCCASLTIRWKPRKNAPMARAMRWSRQACRRRGSSMPDACERYRRRLQRGQSGVHASRRAPQMGHRRHERRHRAGRG